MLRTKSILAPLHESDGLRISVMSRHTLNDGTTPDGRLEGLFDEHWPELSPPAQLIGSYYKRGLSWDSFEREFVQHLGSLDSQISLERLIRLAKNGDINLLCIEDVPDKCHRRLIAEACQKMAPSLSIEVR